jgi:hypothetical protein
MGRILHPLFALLASVTRQEPARQLAYLKEENRSFHAQLPEQLVATDQEERRLLRFGKKLGQQLKELISIVTYQPFLRWVREAEAAHTAKKATPKRKPGRPRTPDEIREVLLRLAKENSWGCATNKSKKGFACAAPSPRTVPAANGFGGPNCGQERSLHPSTREPVAAHHQPTLAIE